MNFWFNFVVISGDLDWHALWGCTSDSYFALHRVENRLESRGTFFALFFLPKI